MATAFDIHEWNQCLKIAKEYDLALTLTERIRLDRSTGLMGVFHDHKELYMYLCGYEAGRLNS